jgi:hypothetical protein
MRREIGAWVAATTQNRFGTVFCFVFSKSGRNPKNEIQPEKKLN